MYIHVAVSTGRRLALVAVWWKWSGLCPLSEQQCSKLAGIGDRYSLMRRVDVDVAVVAEVLVSKIGGGIEVALSDAAERADEEFGVALVDKTVGVDEEEGVAAVAEVMVEVKMEKQAEVVL